MAALSDRFEGLRGTVGDRGERMGELGRLWNVSIVGGIGVLDGRGPMSIGSTGNGFGCMSGGRPLALRSEMDGLLEREPVLLVPVMLDGSFRTSISSISSIEGNVCVKSCRLSIDIRGEDDVDDGGDGGPRLDVGTRAWGEGAAVVGEPRDCAKDEGGAVGGDSIWRDKRLGRFASEGDTRGERDGISLDIRLVVETDRPAL